MLRAESFVLFCGFTLFLFLFFYSFLVNGKLEIIVAEDITYHNVSIPSSRTYVSYDAPSKTGFKLIGAFLTGWTGGSSMQASGTLNVCYEKSLNLIDIKSISGATFNNVTVTCLYIKEL